jgi:hypothetical protein
MTSKSKSQQRFFGMVRAAQKGEMESPSSEVSQAATSMSKSDVKKFAKTKHKELPDKVKSEAYYGGEEQRKKDERKATYEKQLKKMLPKRAFDQMGREIDPRSGKLKEEKNGRCPTGQYYCYTDEKCKPIPKGFKMVGRAGYLRKENGHSVDDDENKNGNGSNGNGNGSNGNGSNGNGGDNGGSSSVGESYDANDYNTLKGQIGSSKSHRKTFKQFMGKSKS